MKALEIMKELGTLLGTALACVMSMPVITVVAILYFIYFAIRLVKYSLSKSR